MCIILTCAKNVRPSDDVISTCFYNNPDGAGIMWVEGGRVHTAKGFMDEGALVAAIDSVPADSPLVIHMRIATSGGVSASVCHPFPVCRNIDTLHAQSVECSAAVAHNGIIHGEPTDNKHGISDTVHFVSHTIADMWRNDNKLTRKMRRRLTNAAPGNRFAIMTERGDVYRVGDGWETVANGIEASNSSWRWMKKLAVDWDKYYLDWNKEYSTYLDKWSFDDDYLGDDADDDTDKLFLDMPRSYTSSPEDKLAKGIDTLCSGCPYTKDCKANGPSCALVADDMEDLGIINWTEYYQWQDTVLELWGSGDFTYEQAKNYATYLCEEMYG